MSKDDKEEFSPVEAQRRLVAALRGARIAGHKSMADIKRDVKAGKKTAQRAKKKAPPKRG